MMRSMSYNVRCKSQTTPAQAGNGADQRAAEAVDWKHRLTVGTGVFRPSKWSNDTVHRRRRARQAITPPSELMRPPSNVAVIFLRSTDGSENGSRLSSIMAGVAASDSARG